MDNYTWLLNATDHNDTTDELLKKDTLVVKYVVIPVVLICLCTIAVLINVRILVATRWLRRPISPTLFISLSLALADSVNASLVSK